MTDVLVCRKKEVLALLAGSKQQRDAVGMSSNNKDFRRYMAKETYWWQMTEMAKEIVVRLSFDGSRLPDGDEVYFRTQRQLHFLHAFPNLQRDMRNSIKAEKQPEIVLSTKRLVYRFAIHTISPGCSTFTQLVILSQHLYT